MKVLGYNGGLDGYPSSFDTGHDAAAALVIDGEIVAACEEERFTREKHTSKFPKNAIEYCLREGGLKSVGELDLVTYYFSYPLMFDKAKYTANRDDLPLVSRPAAWTANAAMKTFNRLAGYDNQRSRRAFESQFDVALRDDQYNVVPHHMCHLASTYYDSPFDRSLVVSFDAEGESASGMVAVANDTTIKVRQQTYAPNSLGYLYALITRFLGFDKHDEYKVMGLAPYGDPTRFREYFKTIVRNTDDGSFVVDPGLITWLQARETFFKDNPIGYPSSLTHGLGPAREKHDAIVQRHMDIAASLQECLENTVLEMLAFHQRATGEKHLCLAGGVALNCSMNGKIARSGLFDEVWVHPAAHDSGTSVGAALFGYHNLLKQPRTLKRRTTAYLGPSHDNAALESALREFAGNVKHSKPQNLADDVAQAIAAGKVVGWYHGRMEWGPRALGNRSILADPRRDDMKDIVNHAVKLREGFRPFAPACLLEHASEWFDMTGLRESPFMLFIVKVLDEKLGKIPAVTHVDGSARVQTVSREQNPKFYSVLEAFNKITGVPILLNTSFNVKGEPIVNTPADAIRCFLNTQIDLLVIEDVVIEKRPEVASALARERGPQRADTGRVIDGQISMA